MAAPENHTLRLLREMDRKNEERHSVVLQKFESMDQRLKNLQKAMVGESVMGRYMVAEVEERIGKLEDRMTAFEQKR
jgi:lipase chaperone LimK